MSEAPATIPLILNPKAKGERGKRALAFFAANADLFTIHTTQSREEAVELARQFAKEKIPKVIAAGGDGTLNAVIEGLAGSQTALGIFPTGTMNVFAREMSIPFRRLDDSLAVINEGDHGEVDLFRMNGTPFVQMAGIGFDARVIEETSWVSKKRFGPLAYLWSAVKVLRAPFPKLTAHLPDGETIEAATILVGNGSLYGGQFSLFRKAKNTDQLLDVIIFKEGGWQFLKDTLGGLVRGGISDQNRNGSVVYRQTPSLRVTSKNDVPVEVDGELWGNSSEINFLPVTETLRVLAPQPRSE